MAIRRFLADDRHLQHIQDQAVSVEGWEQFYWKFPDDTNDTEVSLRKCDDKTNIVTKISGKQLGHGPETNSTRETFTVAITPERHGELLALLANDPDNPIYKHKRYTIVDDGGNTVTVDAYENREHSGLNIVRVKFDSPEEAIAYSPPDWFGEEITNHPDYTGQHYPRVKQNDQNSKPSKAKE